jgi:hypothetical protein
MATQLEEFVKFSFSELTTFINEKGEEKKKMCKPPAWKTITKDNYKNYLKNNDKAFATITGEMSGITVFDFDKIELYNKLVLEHPEMKNMRTIQTKNGVHIYCSYEKEILTTTDKPLGLDIRNDDAIVFCPPTSYVLQNKEIAVYKDLGGDILPVPSYFKQLLKQYKIEELKIKPKKEPSNAVKKNNINKSGMEELLFLIDPNIINYNDYIKVVIAYAEECGKDGLDSFLEWNSQYSGANMDADEKTYLSFIEKQNDVSIGTLRFIAKRENPKGFQEWCDKNVESKQVCSNDQEASDYLFDRLNNKLVYCDGVLYYKNGNYWISNRTELENVLLVLVLHSDIYKQDKKGAYVAYAQNVSSAKRIVEAIVARAYEKKDDSFYSKFHTSMKGKLCFNNGVFDFPTKTFTRWEDLQEEVFATFGITYDYNPIRNESVNQEVKEKVFDAIFENDAEKALRSFSRGMAGHYTDKNWIMFQGNRDCGKGVLDGFFKSTFQNYTTSLSNDNFLYERNSGESEASKKWGWAMALEFARICFTQESKTDNTNKHLKLDGTKIKGIASGGDNMKGRQLYENTRNFMIEALLVMCGNDFPPVSPADAMETCITLSSTKQFKSESFIREKTEDKASKEELSCYVVADPTIKDKCSSVEWRTALMHILSDFYSSKLVERVNLFAEDSNDSNPISKILNDFELSTNEKDKVSNEDLKEWSLEHNISLVKMKQILKSFKCKDYRTTSSRGLSGLRKKLVESEEENLPRKEKDL